MRGWGASAALDCGPGPPWRCDALLPRRCPLKAMGSDPLWRGLLRDAMPSPRRHRLTTTGSCPLRRGLLRIGRPPLCRPVGLVHGLDRAWLWRLTHLALGLVPQTVGGPSSMRPRFWPHPLDDTMAFSIGGSSSRPRIVPRCRVAWRTSVGRLCAGQLAIHMASTVHGCGASVTLPSDLESCPKSLGTNRSLKEREGSRVGKVPGPGHAFVEARTHVLDACDTRPANGQELPFSHCFISNACSCIHTRRGPLPPGRSPARLWHTRRRTRTAACLSHHDGLPRRLPPATPSHHDALPPRRPPTTTPSHHDALSPRRPPRPPRHPTGHGMATALSHSWCTTAFSGIRNRREDSKPSLARVAVSSFVVAVCGLGPCHLTITQ
jgi:hypothetical protein